MSARENLARLSRTLLGSSLVILVVGLTLQNQLKPRGPLLLSAVACALAMALPAVAVVLRGEGLRPAWAAETDRQAAERFGRRLAFVAVNESACVLCAAALMISAPPWPALAALLPLAAMALNLPPREPESGRG